MDFSVDDGLSATHPSERSTTTATAAAAAAAAATSSSSARLATVPATTITIPAAIGKPRRGALSFDFDPCITMVYSGPPVLPAVARRPPFTQPSGDTRLIQPEVESPETSKRRRGRPRLSETGQRARAAPTPAKAGSKTKRRRPSTTSASDDDDSSSYVGGGGGDDDDDDKKNRVRARNREAAHKCRQKTQKGISQLQTQEAVMGGINKSLKSEAEMLRGEILLLKHMVLQHSGCGCSFIEEYIAGAAQNLVQSGARIATTPGGGHTETDGQHSMAGGDDCYIDRSGYDTHSKADMYLNGFESGLFDFDSTPYHVTGIQL